MKKAIDDLLDKHRGHKDMLKLVDQDYSAVVHQSATDPNSLHPTTKWHINQYLKHLAKQMNASSSLNTSAEKLVDTQLWHSLTEGSATVHVPVVELPPAIVNPADPVSRSTDTQSDTQDKVQQEQQQQQQQQKAPQGSPFTGLPLE